MSAMHAVAVTLFLNHSQSHLPRQRVMICEYVIYACNSDRHRKQITILTVSTLH